MLARTDPRPERSTGASRSCSCRCDQPGIEVRPDPDAHRATSEFNEVFFTDARTRRPNVVGQVNGGWAVAMTLLGLERGEEAATNPILFRAELDRLLATGARTRAHRRSGDPPAAGRRHTQGRDHALPRLADPHQVLLTGTLGPEASISKLYWSEYHQEVTELALDVLGADALVRDGRPPLRAYPRRRAGRAEHDRARGSACFYNARAGTIYAGTSPGAAQHPRRDRPRPAQGAPGTVSDTRASRHVRASRRCGVRHRPRVQAIVRPPLTDSVWPVM